MVRQLLLLTITLFSATALFAQTTVNVSDADFANAGNYNWTAENTYILTDMVFVRPGSRLFIEAGTLIKGNSGSGNNATGLVITRGAQIFAEGTADNPIVFTSVADQRDGSASNALRGLWGGIVVLGAATTNNATEGGVKLIEGVNEIANPSSLAEYGGSNDDDNSGIIRYVSIRHTGINVGDVDGNEIQGLTMGGVGRGTVIEYVESFASNDDGFEWFGGTVDAKYLVASFNTDDGFDWDEGFRGRGQFWFAIQNNAVADGYGRGMEMDGATGDENTTPYAKPILSNITVLGAGLNAGANEGDGSQLLIFRDNTGAEVYNSIFGEQDGYAVQVEDIDNAGSKPFDSRQRLEDGDLKLENNLWYGFGAGTDIAALTNNVDFLQTYLGDAANGNVIADPSFAGTDRTRGAKGLNPIPAAAGAAFSNAVKEVDDLWFSKTTYRGAFGSRNWAKGWTALDEYGYFADDVTAGTISVSDADFAEAKDYYWTSDNVYTLNDMVFVRPGSRLFIEAGTLVKGNSGSGNNATGLVITRGAQIFAEGSSDAPIVFTAAADQRDGSASNQLRGLWGGIVVLGAATTNNATEGGVKLIEGVNEIANPSSLAEYGGSNDDDNSGIIRYVSIRHTGINVGDVDGNEIQGLTLGGVGRGTTIEYVESFASNDDGFEWFGGTVDAKYLVSAFNTDDAFDWDEGFRGRGQFWFAVQNNAVADGYGRGMEMDGAGGDENTTPFAQPILSNITVLGAGIGAGENQGDGSQLLIFRDNTGAEVYNSIFGEQDGYGVQVEDVDNAGSKPFDSRQRLEAGDLKLENNLWFGFGAGSDLAAITNNVDYLQTYLGNADNGNQIADPNFYGTDRTRGAKGLDPRPSTGSVAWTKGYQSVDDAFFTNVNYIGAFGYSNWMKGWTALDEYGYIKDSAVSNEDNSFNTPTSILLAQNFPNPFNPTTQISFTLPSAQNVSLQVVDLTGRVVATLVNGMVGAGAQTFTFDASALSSGVYMYQLRTATGVFTKKMTLMK